MTSVLGISMPTIGLGKDDSVGTKALTGGGIVVGGAAVGGLLGKLGSANPLVTAGIGAAIGAVAVGAALLGNAADSGGGHYDYDPYHGDYHYDPGYHDDGHYDRHGDHYDYHDPHHY